MPLSGRKDCRAIALVAGPVAARTVRRIENSEAAPRKRLGPHLTTFQGGCWPVGKLPVAIRRVWGVDPATPTTHSSAKIRRKR
jgi:hypothetical protein